MLSAPTKTAPAASSRSISVASRDDGARSRLIFDPARVGRPLTSNRFFTANGTPASGPTFCPAAIAASTARALARARSAVTSVKELSTPSCLAIRASAASVTSSAETLRAAPACAIASADIPSVFTVIVRSGCVDTGRLGFIRQRELVDQPRQPQRYFEVRPHGRPPRVLDRQRQRVRNGVDVDVQVVSSHFTPISLVATSPASSAGSCPSAPATADAGSPSAVPLYRHLADCPRPVRTCPARRYAPTASR